MEFRPHCPKCGSRNIYVERDRALGWGNPEPVLHCKCGTMVYGKKNIEALRKSQLAVWEKGAAERANKKAAWEKSQEEKMSLKHRVAEATRKQKQAQRAAKAAAERERILDNARWLARIRGQQPPPLPKGPSPLPKSPSPAHKGRLSFPCTHCGGLVWKRPYEVKRNKTGKFFCSPAHHKAWFVATGGPARLSKLQHAKRSIPPKAPEAPPQPTHKGRQSFPCAHCGELVWKRPYEVKRNKTGRFFCSTDHQRAWVIKAKGYYRPPAQPPKTPASTSGQVCGWKDCSYPPAENSRYCSVQCRNRKARHGYKMRKRLKKASA